MNSISRKTLFTISIVLLPITSMYKCIGTHIDVGLVLTIFLLFILLQNNKYTIKFDKRDLPWMAYIIVIIVSTLFAIQFPNTSSATIAIGRALRNILCTLIFMVGSSNDYFDGKCAKFVYIFVVKISTAYIYAQTFAARVLNTILPGYIFPLVRKESYVLDLKATSPLTFRPSSFFYEPSHYFIFVVLALVVFLFSKKEKNNMFWACFVSGGVVLSGSSMGILVVAALWTAWLAYLIFNLFKSGVINICQITIVLFLCVALFFLLRSSRVAYAITRVFDNQTQGGSAISGRNAGYLAAISMPVTSMICGYGYGNLPSDYYPSFIYNYLCMGLVGLWVTINALHSVYLQINKRISRIGFFIYIVLCFYGEIFMSTYLNFFMFMLQFSDESLDF